ncbi:MAG: thioredoxin [Odoribacteraceae bacterium]|nr:thioredoxin [Odoribacteraceae bacterium]
MKNLLLVMLFASICSISCKESARTIERPTFEVRNTNTLEIDKIILTDTATIFYIDAFYRPKYWIRIDPQTYLQAGDRKYFLTGSEGIELGKEFWMPESGEASFVLMFQPIDRKLKKIDFIESDCDECFKLYDIDLTGKASPAGYPEGLPRELRDARPDMSGSLPEAELNIGTTRINLHLLGYRKGMSNGKGTIYNRHVFSPDEVETVFPIDEEGNASMEFEQYGTMRNLIFCASGLSFSFISSPGETLDIYVDLQESGRRGARYLKAKNTPKPVLYFTGQYTAINQAINNPNNKYKLELQDRKTYDEIAGMNADEYVDYVITKYKDISEVMAQSTDLSAIEKELLDLDNKLLVHSFIINGENQLERAFRIKNKIPGEQRELKNYNAPRFTKKHYETLKDLRIDGTTYLYAEMFPFIYSMYFTGKTDLEMITGHKEGFLYDLQKIHRLSRKVGTRIPWTDHDQAELASVKNPFYANVLSVLDKKFQKQLEDAKNKTGYTICEVPKVSDEKLFDAIIGNYKGKVVLVDFWATWCAPCRSAISQTEPLKDNVLKNDNLVFLYLTGPSSPEIKWLTMISDIKGEHYRVNEKQWNYVCDKFGIDGIPSYVLVDKNSNYKLRNDFRNHETMKKTLLEEVAK